MSRLIGKIKSRDPMSAKIAAEPNIKVSMSSGARGKSAYEVWLDEGNSGTIEQYLNSLKAMSNIETFVHRQTVASSVWNVNHRLNRQPSVTIVDSAGSVVVGEVDYIDENNITIYFTSEFGGMAYLN